MSSSDVHERAVNLFTFLREIASMRSKTIRSLEKYDSVIWFDEIPEKDNCLNVFDVPEDERAELWLEVEQPRIPSPPQPPGALKDWIIDKELNNPALEQPNLRKSITIKKRIEEKTSDLNPRPYGTTVKEGSITDTNKAMRVRFERETLKLEDQPKLTNLWADYVENDWKKWSAKVHEHVPVLELYDSVFNIHHVLQKIAESYELLIGFGCLSWKTPSNQEVYRHILTSRVSLHFDSARGLISVSSPNDGHSYVLEQDMLEMNERPSQKVKGELQGLLDELNEDFWNQAKLDEFLGAYARAISSRGIYSDSLKKTPRATNVPQISFAPALILRKRTDLHFVRLFDEIVDQLENANSLPLGVERLVSIKDDETLNEGGATASGDIDDDEIYFPLPSNPDQNEIAYKLRTRQGILVQGPPGTGKSHTITNLVCHLLSQGKRVLVTSHTPRALTVLRDRFPDGLKSLCVSVVGDDSAESRQALEESVSGITHKHQSWNASQNEIEITEARGRLDELRQSEQWILNSLRSIKEKEIYKHTKKFGTYSGTAQEIAHQLNFEYQKYSWMDVRPDEDDQSPFTNRQAMELLDLVCKFDPQTELTLEKSTIPLESLVTPSRFTELVTRYGDLKERLKRIENLTSHESYKASTSLNSDARNSLVSKFDELIRLYQRIAKRPEAFAKVAAQEITGDHDRKWRDLYEISRGYLKEIGDDYKDVAKKTIVGMEGRSLLVVRDQAVKLRDHLRNGGKLGFGIFRKKVVKDSIFILQNVFVEGKSCSDLETLDELVEWLELSVLDEKLRKQWEGVSDTIPTSLVGSIATFLDYCEPLEDALKLWDQMIVLREELDRFPSLIAPVWEDLDSVKEFREIIDGGSVEEELSQYEETFLELETVSRTAANDPSAHPLVSKLFDAITTKDDELYHKVFEENEELLKCKQEIELRDELLSCLQKISPSLASAVSSASKSEEWEDRFKEFEQAFIWAKAAKWIEGLSDPTHFIKLTRDLENVQSDIRSELGELGALKAWKHTFERMNEEQRQHLISWTMAVRRIGKGKGKYVEKDRRDAKYHMSFCRTAIPAWIMPIHKVVETIKPGSDAFDVIIVDEASQSGPEALFLLYLGKQLVVVGDDKQISPEFVGMDKAGVDVLRSEYLAGVPHSDAIGIDHSFFDQAKIRYTGKISLKEHFRCMPEIIQFSNNLCYQSEPLIPLRQYGGNRLSPVVEARYLETGYEDDSRRTINKPEAEAILNHLKEISEDPAYENKTIGVISLLNTSGQADFIDRELTKYVSKKDIDDRKIRVGDAYVFQGDERDVILLSMVAAPEEGKSKRALTAERYERTFNVAVSRARDQLFLYHSISLNDLSPKCVRHKLISYCQNPSVEMSEVDGLDLNELSHLLEEGYRLDTEPPSLFDSWFEVDVFIRIARRGYRVIPQLEMNGYRIDLIVEGLKGRIAVECDGDRWHSSAENYDRDTARQRDLERCGLRFCRIKGSAFYHKPDSALEELWSTLERYEIYPREEAVLNR